MGEGAVTQSGGGRGQLWLLRREPWSEMFCFILKLYLFIWKAEWQGGSMKYSVIWCDLCLCLLCLLPWCHREQTDFDGLCPSLLDTKELDCAAPVPLPEQACVGEENKVYSRGPWWGSQKTSLEWSAGGQRRCSVLMPPLGQRLGCINEWVFPLILVYFEAWSWFSEGESS